MNIYNSNYPLCNLLRKVNSFYFDIANEAYLYITETDQVHFEKSTFIENAIQIFRYSSTIYK